MKRRLITIMIVLISISTVANAQIRRTRRALPWTMGGRHQAQVQRHYTPRVYSSYRSRPWTMGGRRETYVQRGYIGYGTYGRNYRRSPSTNINVRYNERWDSMGGERSYEQSPDLLGKIIDGGILLGAISILAH